MKQYVIARNYIWAVCAQNMKSQLVTIGIYHIS